MERVPNGMGVCVSLMRAFQGFSRTLHLQLIRAAVGTGREPKKQVYLKKAIGNSEKIKVKAPFGRGLGKRIGRRKIAATKEHATMHIGRESVSNAPQLGMGQFSPCLLHGISLSKIKSPTNERPKLLLLACWGGWV